MTPSGFPHFAVVLNKAAGRGLAARQWPQLQAALAARSIEYELLETASAHEAVERVLALPQGVAVMAVGGDGTVTGLLPAVVNTGRALATIPLGSGNDFAGMLGLNPKTLNEALDRLFFAPRDVDVLEVEVLQGDQAGLRRFLLNGLGMGFDAQVNEAMLRAPGALPGFGRYAWGAVTTIRDLRLTEVEIQLDGQPFYTGKSCLCAVMNGTRYGGGFQISPRSDARDGRLDVIASGPIGRAELTRLMLQVLRGQHIGKRKVHAAQGQTTHIRWAEPIPLHLDGDGCGRVTELSVQVRPAAVRLLNG